MSWLSEHLADSPSAFVRLGERSGTSAADAIGGTAGTYNGGVTLGQATLVPSDPDPAALFDGTNDYVSFAHRAAFDIGNRWTVKLRVRPTAYRDTGGLPGTLIDFGSGSLIIRFDTTFDGQWIVRRNGVATVATSTARIPLNVVTEIAVSWDGTTLRMEQAGVDVTGRVTSTTFVNNALPFCIGAADGGTGNFFTGTLDEVAVFTTALSAARTAAHLAAATTIPLETASETDAAPAATLVPGAVAIALGIATEVDTAPAAAAAVGPLTVPLEVARETDSALDMTGNAPAPTEATAVLAMPTAQRADISILLQALDGTWERCGSDRAIGVVPESVVAAVNEYGPDIASFDLKRNPGALWPDLGSFSPVIIECGGIPIWRGRTDETPIKDGAAFVINVQCRGLQYHLDDDVYQRAYVHQKLGDYKDLRSIPTAQLAANAAAAAGQVSTDNAITLTWPAGTAWAAGSTVGVVLDLGPYSRAAAIVIDYETSAGSGGGIVSFFARSASTPDQSGWPGSDAFSQTMSTMAASGTIAANFPSVANRYVHLFLWASGAFTPGADNWIKLKRVQVFTEQAFRSGSASVLLASTIVRDAIAKATMLLSDDLSQITATTFAIPEFVLNGMRTPREVIEAANAFHNWRTKIDIADRLVFGPRPTTPQLEVGAWSGADFEDSSANSGAEIYNKVVVEGQGSDGTPIVVERTSGQQTGVLFTPVPSPAAVNPSADVDASGWSATSGAVARDTGVFLTSPASIRWSGMSSGGILSADMTGTFIRGITYRITLSIQSTVAVDNFNSVILIVIGDGTGGLSAAANRWGTATLSWTPTADTVNPDLQIYVLWNITAPTIYVDDIAISAVQPTLVDRRGFRKAKVLQPSVMLTTAVAQQLGDVFLAAHKTMPLKGSLRVTPGGCRQVLGGQPVHPSLLLTKSQELLRLSHRLDPDTGAVGRTGTIVSVRYSHREQAAQVELDDPRRNFEALLSRLAVLQGGS